MDFLLVDNIDIICSRIKQIFYRYEVCQGIFDEYSEKIRFRQGPPVIDNFKEFENCLLILDDMMFIESSPLSKYLQFTLITTALASFLQLKISFIKD